MCAACARPRGAFALPTRLLTRVRPVAGGRASPSPSGSPPYFLPSRLPLRPSTSTSHSPGHHSGVLFPGQGDPWGEPSVARSRLVPVPSLCCAHARESRLRAADPEKPHVQSSPRAMCRLPALSLYRPGTFRGRSAQHPNPSPPGSHLPQFRAPHMTPATGRGIA